jgi:hypothetical protein
MTKKRKDRIRIVFEPEEHDEKTCFRCRLHQLFLELKDQNETRFMCLAMAEACGSMLSQVNDITIHEFMLLLSKTYNEDKEDKPSKYDPGKSPTKH